MVIIKLVSGERSSQQAITKTDQKQQMERNLWDCKMVGKMWHWLINPLLLDYFLFLWSWYKVAKLQYSVYMALLYSWGDIRSCASDIWIENIYQSATDLFNQETHMPEESCMPQSIGWQKRLSTVTECLNV